MNFKPLRKKKKKNTSTNTAVKGDRPIARKIFGNLRRILSSAGFASYFSSPKRISLQLIPDDGVPKKNSLTRPPLAAKLNMNDRWRDVSR